MVQRLISSVLLLAGVALAQMGLPQVGVLLGGTVSAPVIINNSSHRILAYTLLFDRGNGTSHTSRYVMLGQLRRRPMSAVGIAPGASFAHQTDLHVQVRDAAGQSPLTGATAVALDSVLFDDGTLVGPDKAASFDILTARIQAEKDVHAILVTANGAASAWTALEKIASGQTVPPAQPGRSRAYQDRYLGMSKEYAAELLGVRSKGGDLAALGLANSPVFYPMIVKGE